ncbi:cell division cycle protein 16 homolog [Centruroides sculpturatus]|nr:cell division cycle protein 16 homolog [Centruroides sculpturatus]
MKNWALAVEYFHKALGLQKDDTFSTSMLTYVIENLMNVITPCEDVPEELPSYEFSLLSHSVRDESGHGEGPSETSMSISIEVEMEETDQ